jgi:hypothetical protein
MKSDRRFKNVTGQKFGLLTAVERDGKNERSCYTWTCLCECGKTKSGIVVSNLLRGKVKSCGCLMHREKDATNIKDFGEATFNMLLSSYKKCAIRRGHEFKLTREEFKFLTKQICYYCGEPPSRKSEIKRLNGFYIYNGVDRVDNTKGYLIDNCVSACTLCNSCKRAMPVSDWENFVIRSSEHIKNRREKV